MPLEVLVQPPPMTSLAVPRPPMKVLFGALELMGMRTVWVLVELLPILPARLMSLPFNTNGPASVLKSNSWKPVPAALSLLLLRRVLPSKKRVLPGEMVTPAQLAGSLQLLVETLPPFQTGGPPVKVTL